MDLFWLDKTILKTILNLSYYQFFLINFGGLVGAFLYSGTFSNKQGGKRR
ncbi:hypothetical protein [Clostridium botulinum]|nr:hypothetical protein [Clostridium botulinum]MBY6800100.1 hypothetical protein [Clostridium botulinum]MBY6842275.1 hypothetical protein [Clostridium botulinum]MBY6844518.1 hypothetical protein [Clostridium botulinum]HBJ2603968.1 hypothetical protein [Clostridium botulinum]HDK7165957.1 hypothetical protein [Clostridium botulinum]